MTLWRDIGQHSPILMHLLGFLLLSIYKDAFFVYYIIASISFRTVVAPGLKKLFQQVLPEDSALVLRPDPTASCGFGKEGKFHFPSGHSETVSASVILLLCWVASQKSITPSTKLVWYVLGVFFIFFVDYTRLEKKCHNIEQVSAGTLLGALIGMLSFKMWLLR